MTACMLLVHEGCGTRHIAVGGADNDLRKASRVCSIVKNQQFGAQAPPLAARAHKKYSAAPNAPGKQHTSPTSVTSLREYSK